MAKLQSDLREFIALARLKGRKLSLRWLRELRDSAVERGSFMSTIRRADPILLIEDGRVIERGTHEERMSARGIYHGLRQMEAHAQKEEELWR